MKLSATRFKMIAGVFGTLCVSLPGVISAEGVPLKGHGTPVGENAVPVGENAVPIGEGAVPIGEGAVPIGEGAVPIGEGAVPIGEGAVPIGEGAVPVGEGAVPVGEGAVPVGEGAVPVGEGAVPVGEGAVPVGEGAVPVGEGAVPVGEGAVPVGEGAVPVGEGAVSTTGNGTPVGEYAVPVNNGVVPIGTSAAMDVQAQQRRLQNRTAAMNQPATARFFSGDAATRVANVSRNVAIAGGLPMNVPAPAMAQQDAQDRDWSAGVVASAASRPKNLFTKDWWASHPDVLSGTNRFYADKPDFTWWQSTPWDVLVQSLGMKNVVLPIQYGNDQNITFQNDLIYLNGQPVSSYEDFVASARILANTHPKSTTARPGWFPLGTFAASSNSDSKTSGHVLQLAIDGVGNISGAYVNWPQGNVLPVSGSVDLNSQLVAFNIGGSDDVVVQTGLSNLTEEYSRVWVHLPNSHSQTWLITRIKPGGE